MHTGSGDDGEGEGGDDDETEGATERRKTRDNMASDAQRLTSEFAAGRLAAPHFFGAMLVSCGMCACSMYVCSCGVVSGEKFVAACVLFAVWTIVVMLSLLFVAWPPSLPAAARLF